MSKYLSVSEMELKLFRYSENSSNYEYFFFFFSILYVGANINENIIEGLNTSLNVGKG